MNVVEDGEKIVLGELEPGTLFRHNGTIALLSDYCEYATNGIAGQAYIVGSGERFWGGTQTAEDLNNLLVQPLKITDYANY